MHIYRTILQNLINLLKKKTYKSRAKEQFNLQSIGMLDVSFQNLERFLVGFALSHIQEKHLNTTNLKAD